MFYFAKSLVLSFIFFLFSLPLFSQENQNEIYTPIDHSNTIWCLEMFSETPNVLKAQKAYNEYFKIHPKEESKLRSVFKRWVEDATLSMDKDGFFIKNPYQPSKFLKWPSAQEKTETWSSIGPNFAEKTQCGTSSSLSGGFCDRVYINPSNTNNLFAGFSYGGLWVSQDQGTTWTLSDGSIPNGTNTYANRDYYYGEIEASSINPELIYAATEYGLLKSVNSGQNWTVCPQLNREDSGNLRSYFTALSKENENLVLSTFGRKVYRSEDAGDTWTMVFDNENGGPNHYYTSQYSDNSNFGIYERTYNFFGLEKASETEDIFYLGVYNAQNNPEIYKSVDGGLNFELLVDLNDDLNRNLPNNLFLEASENASTNFFIHSLFNYDSLYQYNQNGDLQFRKALKAETTTFGNDVDALEAFAINPDNENEMYAGFYFSSAIMKSGSGGEFFFDQTSGYSGCPKYVHPDVRSIDVQGDLVLIGSDGGLAISTDAMNTVSSDIGREISSIDLWGFSSSSRTDLIAVGCDHGPTKIRRYDGENGWYSIGGGDASDLSINSSNEKWLYCDRAINYQFKIELDEENNVITDQSINDDIDLNLMNFHPYLYKTAYAIQENSIKKLNNNFTSILTLETFSSNIRKLILAPDNPNIFYVLLNNSKIRKSIDTGETWTEITPSNAESNGESNITDIALGGNEDEIWAAYGNWQENTKVLKSNNGGDNWQDISSASLPVAPVSKMVYQEGTEGGIYLSFGGGLGVWYRNNEMTQFEELGTGLPSMGFIRNIFTVPNKGKIRIGGARGVWEHDLYEASNPVANFAVETNEISCGNSISFIQNSTHGEGEVEYEWHFPGGSPEFSNEAAPTVEYFIEGNFDVSLTVTSASGMSNTQILAGFITITNNENCIISDIKNIVEENVKVYPSPAEESILVELPIFEKNINLKILNSLGQVIIQKKMKNVKEFNLDISEYTAGVYFLEIEGNEKEYSKKIIKK